jgi:alkylation response protein AidB-like acyl-CoA dehydrogenase
MRLADMLANAELARLAWQASARENGERGLLRDLHRPGARALGRLLPSGLIGALAPRVLDHPWTTRLLRRRHFTRESRAAAHLTSGWGSLAKVVGSDLALANADLALELLGPEATRHGAVEKLVRDAKLLQIYEGTNQLNRLNLFKCLVGPGRPAVDAFA